MPAPTAVVQQQEVQMSDLEKLGDEKAQRQHLGNMIFPHASLINAVEAPKVVGLIVFHLPVP
jgi:hypothetical protein